MRPFAISTARLGAKTTPKNDTDQDVVTDFQVGVDKIDFSNNANFINAFDEFRQYSQQTTDGHVVIDTGAGTITLENVDREAITADDFYF